LTRVLELPGCFSSGDTAEEAMEMRGGAIAKRVDAELQDGHDIPPPPGKDFDPETRLALRPIRGERATASLP